MVQFGQETVLDKNGQELDKMQIAMLIDDSMLNSSGQNYQIAIEKVLAQDKESEFRKKLSQITSRNEFGDNQLTVILENEQTVSFAMKRVRKN